VWESFELSQRRCGGAMHGREPSAALFLASLRFCVHYCIDSDADQKKKPRCPQTKNRASRGFCFGLPTKNLKIIKKQATIKQKWLI